MPDNLLVVEQIRRNSFLRDSWTRYAAHRKQVMKLLLTGNHPTPNSLRIVGAGNCHDLDLPVLADHFAKVQLIDLDEAAMVAEIKRQQLDGDPRIELRTSDVNQLGSYLAKLSPDPP